jgi:hypothetical protein
MKDLIFSPQTQDLEIQDGDILIQESTDQEVEAILLSTPGDFVEAPLIGLSIYKLLNGPLDLLKLRSRIKAALVGDNMEAVSIEISSETININARRLK